MIFKSLQNYSKTLPFNELILKILNKMQESQIKKIRECIDKISLKSNYQRVFVIYMCFVWFEITYGAMIPSYVYMNPLFQCDNQTATQIQACSSNFESNSFTINQNCKITNDFTATYYDGLYCQNKQSRSFIQSIFAFGALVGMFGLPAFSDLYGRRPAIIIAFFMGILSMSLSILGIYNNYVILMIIGSFINGIQCSGLVLLTYIITGQFCKNSFRQSAILIYASVWGLSQISFYFLYNYMPEWDFFLIVIVLIPSCVFFILSFFLLQSPEYCLVMAKNIEKFNKNIDKLSKYNNASQQDVDQIKKLASEMIDQLKKSEGTQQKASMKDTMSKIIKNKLIIRTVLCLAVSQISYNIFYYGVQGSLERTGYNFGFSMFLIGIHQFLAYLSTSYIINKVRRKKGLIIAILFTSVTGLSFLFHFINNSFVLQSIVISVTRIGCVYAYSFLSIIQTQSFPAQIKSTAIGLTVGLSQCGRIVVPYIITAMNDVGINPLIASSIIFLTFGILPLIPVRETFVKKQEFTKESLLNQSEQQ